MILLIPVLLLVIAAYCFITNRNTSAKIDELYNQRQNLLMHFDDLEQQVDQIQRDVAYNQVSIRYAEKIQRSIIPSAANFRKSFPDSFVFFAPRDIVSGDFYMLEDLANYSVVVVADCTGHGIPGGFLSMLGMSGLKEILPKFYSREHIPTGKILNRLRTFLISALSETIPNGSGSDMEVSDGIEITIVAFDRLRRMMTYSLAGQCIYLVRGGQVQRLKGDSMPVGRHPKQDKPFAEKSMVLSHGDMIYLPTDGITDQIGGPSGTKFMTRRLLDWISRNWRNPMDEQLKNISDEVGSWKNGVTQVDDQTIIGIRIQ